MYHFYSGFKLSYGMEMYNIVCGAVQNASFLSNVIERLMKTKWPKYIQQNTKGRCLHVLGQIRRTNAYLYLYLK